MSTLNVSPAWRDRLWAYIQLTRFDRPVGIELLLWPTLWAVWLAGNGQPAWSIVLIFGLGAVLMRAAGCAINDFADRKFDGQVARTQHRPLASGSIQPWEALLVFAVLVLASASLLLFLPLAVFSETGRLTAPVGVSTVILPPSSMV